MFTDSPPIFRARPTVSRYHVPGHPDVCTVVRLDPAGSKPPRFDASDRRTLTVAEIAAIDLDDAIAVVAFTAPSADSRIEYERGAREAFRGLALELLAEGAA